MISFTSSSQEIDCGTSPLRRSDRKRTKKIFKQDLVVKSTHKQHPRPQKKHKSLFINQNILSSQIPLYPQQHSHHSTNIFPFKPFQTNIQALQQMRQAVNRQQIKYGQLMQTKLSIPINKMKQIQEKLTSQTLREEYNSKQQKQQMLIGEYDIERASDDISYDQCDIELVRMVTGSDDMQLQFQCMRLESEFHNQEDCKYSTTFDDIQCHDLYLSGIIPCRKESAIMLSDDYQSNELTYTMEQLQPKWLKEENIQHVEW